MLRDLGLAEQVDGGQVVELLNKIDLLAPEARRVLVEQVNRAPSQLPISAATGEGVEALLAEIDNRLAAAWQIVEYRLPHGQGGNIAWLYAHGQVLERRDEEDCACLRVRLDPADVSRFERMTRQPR